MLCSRCKRDVLGGGDHSCRARADTENERLADRLLLIAARLSVDSPLGWGRPDCVTLQEAAGALRGEPKQKPDDGRAIGVLS